MSKFTEYLTEAKPKRNKFARAYLKFADKSLNDIGNKLRDLKFQASILEKQMKQKGSFNSVNTLIGQSVGLLQTISDELQITVEDMEFDEVNQ
jgi:hypothetical protein